MYPCIKGLQLGPQSALHSFEHRLYFQLAMQTRAAEIRTCQAACKIAVYVNDKLNHHFKVG